MFATTGDTNNIFRLGNTNLGTPNKTYCFGYPKSGTMDSTNFFIRGDQELYFG